MSKIICETTGDFQLVDFGDGARVIPAHRPSVTAVTSFVSARAAAGQIRTLATVSDEATDEEFQNYLRDCDDVALAIESFSVAFAEESKSVTGDASKSKTTSTARKGKV